MDCKNRNNRNENWYSLMIDRFKRIKKEMIINLEYTKLVIKNIEDIKIKSNKLNKKRQWLKRLF